MLQVVGVWCAEGREVLDQQYLTPYRTAGTHYLQHHKQTVELGKVCKGLVLGGLALCWCHGG